MLTIRQGQSSKDSATTRRYTEGVGRGVTGKTALESKFG